MSADPDQRVSDQDLYCLLIEYSIKIWGKNRNIQPNIPEIRNGSILLIGVGKSIQLYGLNMCFGC